MKSCSLFAYVKDSTKLENFLQVLALSKEDYTHTVSIYTALQNPKEISKKPEIVQIEVRVDNLNPNNSTTIQNSFVTQERDRKTYIKSINKGNIKGSNLSEFFAAMDFRFEYDYIQKGVFYTLKNANITVSTIQRNTKDQGMVDNGKLVEICGFSGVKNINDVENDVINIGENLKMFAAFTKP